jgi:signal transduction histidine kinase
MDALNAVFHALSNPPYRIRLLIVLTSGLIGFLFCLLTYPAPYSNGLLVIPVALSAWLYKQNGVLICGICLGIMLMVFYTLGGRSFAGISVVASILSFLGFLAAGLFVCYLRQRSEEGSRAYQSIEGVCERQQRVIAQKEQFIQNVSRELNVSLIGVAGCLKLLTDNIGRIGELELEALLKNAASSCDDLRLLSKNVLYCIDELPSQEDLLEDFNLLDLVQEVVDHLDRRRRQEHTIQLRVPAHLNARANAGYVREILRNLLSNAFKYSPSRSLVIVSASIYGKVVNKDHPAPEICVVVQDFGIGIPPEEIPRLFGQGVHLKRDTPEGSRGAGLGLYVSKRLVEAMGGRIWVESSGTPGQGSNFCFTISYASPRKVASNRRSRVLVMSDPDNLL